MDLQVNKKIKVLFVEDNQIARENGIEYLENYFDTLYSTSNGLDALHLYIKYQPDIVITDIEMPKLNGLDFVKKIRESNKNTQVIITTAYSDKEYLLQAIELQLVKYLIKPINQKEFDNALQICLDNLDSDESNVVKISQNTFFDTYNKTLLQDRNIIKLRTKELELLSLLIKNKKRYVTYQEIENNLWVDSVMTKDALKTIVKNLKSKLPPETISNLSGTGYKIEL